VITEFDRISENALMEISKRNKYPILDLEAWSQLKPTGALIENMLPAVGLGFLYGPTQSYKSFLTIALGGCISTKQPFAGCEVELQGNTLYCLSEGFEQFGFRARAWEIYHDETDFLGRFWNYPINLSSALNVDAVIEQIRNAAIPDLRMIVIDTWIKSAGQISGNSDTDNIIAITNAQRIAEELRCFVLMVDHPGKDVDRGLRGSSAKEQGVDVILRQKAIGERKVSISQEKAKDHETVVNHIFNLKQIQLTPKPNQESNPRWKKLGNSGVSLCLDVTETKRKSWETRARDFLYEGCDEDSLRAKLRGDGAKASDISKVIKKLRQEGNF